MLKAVIFDMYETLITHYRSPLYFGAEIARDAGVPPERFLPLWRNAEHDRTIGRVTLEEVLTDIFSACGCPSEALVARICARRSAVKADCFRQLHPQLLPMLEGLRARGLRIGLVSNCYSEEAAAIRASCLLPYFDAVCLSWEEGVQKPDPEIFLRCTARLGAAPADCLYIGDGGSHELQAAGALGMHTGRALWYLKEHPEDLWDLPGFAGLDEPSAVLDLAARLQQT